jgi:Brp/Blh family beta-carotene 15,15'-monooxygenase
VLETLRPFQLFFLSAGIAIAGSIVFGAQHNWFFLSCCVVVLAAGLPHGAFDIYIIANLFQNKSFVLAILVYLSLIVITVLVWWINPQAFLTLFLIYSAFHFGDSDYPTETILFKASWGLSIIALPCLLATEEVALLFSVILDAEPLPIIANGLSYSALPAVLFCCLKATKQNTRFTTCALLSCYALVCLVGGALIAFSCYFAFLHGPHHLRRWRLKIPDSPNMGIYLISLALFAGIALLTVLAPEINLSNINGLSNNLSNGLVNALDANAIRYTFVALAALTVPHMTFLYIASRRN